MYNGSVKRITAILFGFLLFIIFSRVTFAADIVINEFQVEPSSSQWVELYNKGISSVDISGWAIDDDGGTEKFIIPNGTQLNSNAFQVFESSKFNLNTSSSDTIRLLNNDEVIDSYNYSKSPGSGISYGRITDGTGDWFTYNPPTKGASNNTVTPLPTTTPSPTNTPTPQPATPTSVPTNTPAPPSSTPTKIPAPTTVTPTPTKQLSPSPTIVLPTAPKITPYPTLKLDKSVLGQETIGNELSVSKIPSPTVVRIAGSSINNLGLIFIGIGGVFLIGCGILAFQTLKRTRRS